MARLAAQIGGTNQTRGPAGLVLAGYQVKSNDLQSRHTRKRENELSPARKQAPRNTKLNKLYSSPKPGNRHFLRRATRDQGRRRGSHLVLGTRMRPAGLRDSWSAHLVLGSGPTLEGGGKNDELVQALVDEQQGLLLLLAVTKWRACSVKLECLSADINKYKRNTRVEMVGWTPGGIAIPGCHTAILDFHSPQSQSPQSLCKFFCVWNTDPTAGNRQ